MYIKRVTTQTARLSLLLAALTLSSGAFAQMTNRAPLEPPNRGLMEPAKGSEFQDSDGVIFSRFSLF